jgi:hypothetical protein
VLDASAIIALFGGHPPLERLMGLAEAGALLLLLPTTCMADAESARGRRRLRSTGA